MHIPDGFLNNQVSVSLLAAAAAIFSHAWNKVRQPLWQKQRVAKLVTNEGLEMNDGLDLGGLKMRRQAKIKIQKMALVAAFIFAAQMINFPVAPGTSGHLLGGVLAAIVLGPWAGFIALSGVILVQGVAFGDGGIMALGANIFNMGAIGVIGGYYLFLGLKTLIKSEVVSIFFAAWLSVVLAAVTAAIEVAVSGTIPLNQVLPAMVNIHILIGLGEAMLTLLALKFIFNDYQK